MKFNTDNTLLAHAISNAATGASAGEFSSLLIQAAEGFVRICGTQGTILQVGVTIPADVEEAGSCALKFDDLMGIARVLPKGNRSVFTAAPTSRSALIVSGNAKFTLDTFDTTNIHVADISEAEQHAETLPNGIWGKAIDAVISAVRIDAGNESLHGVHLLQEEHAIRVTGCDGFRVHCAWIPGHIPLPRRGDQYPQIIIQAKTARESAKLIGKGEAAISGQSDWFYVASGDTYMRAAIIDAQYPPIDGMLTLPPDSITIDRSSFAAMLTRVRAGMDRTNRSPTIVLHIHDNQITLRASGSQKAAEETMPAATENYSLRVGINATYLQEAISISKDALLRISFHNESANQSVHFDSGSDARDVHALIMPVRIPAEQE